MKAKRNWIHAIIRACVILAALCAAPARVMAADAPATQPAPTTQPLPIGNDIGRVPASGPTASGHDLSKLSLEDLMNLQVTSVSKMPQNISQAAAAVTVIDQDEISRSGMTSIPDLLRLVPGMDVARIAPGKWAVSVRGFNSQYSDKLLVLMDGRTIYDPLFTGVFWDKQDYVLADLDKIEVIRGPGATLWGSNAVNGVINITTKSAEDTQGLLVTGIGGTLDSGGSVRYGGKLDDDTYYRVYGKFSDTSDFQSPSGTHLGDGQDTTSTGFRVDKIPDAQNNFTVQGDIQYSAVQGITGVNIDTLPGGGSGNLLARWSHTDSDKSGLALQVYYDHADRFTPEVINYHHDAADLDYQQHFPLGDAQEINWGFGTRAERAQTEGGQLVRVPIGAMVMATSSPDASVNESGGTMPVPVMRKQPAGNELSR